MEFQRNVRPCANTTPLLSHPPVTYSSLLDFDRSTPLLSSEGSSSAAPAGDAEWLDEDDIAEQLTALPVPYLDLLRSGVASELDVHLLRDLFDRVRLEQRVAVFKQRPAEYVALFTRLLSTVTGSRVQSQLVTTLQSLVHAYDDIRRTVAAVSKRPDCDIISSLMRLLHSSFERSDKYRELPPHFLPGRLCELLTALLQATLPLASCTGRDHWASESSLRDYIDWLMQQPLKLPPSDSNVPMLATTFKSLRSLLSFPPLLSFFHELEGLSRVSPLLVPSIAAEPYQYNLAFLLWLASASTAHWDEFMSLGLLPHLLNLLGSSRSEKCIRLYLSILDCLLQHSASALLEYLVEAALPSQLQSLSQRHWRDADILKLVAALRTKLDAAQPALTSWALYRTELLSAALHPSPPHSSLAFFHSHLQQFAAHHAAVVRRLLGLLSDRRVSGLSRATAASDLGQLAACGEAGKRLVLQRVSGVKEALLRATSREDEPDAEVRHAAVEALQKLLVPRWDEFERQCTLEAAHLSVRPPIRLPERPVAVISFNVGK